MRSNYKTPAKKTPRNFKEKILNKVTEYLDLTLTSLEKCQTL